MKVSRHALIPFSDQQMFDLVLDVVRYPEFLPWCSEGEVLELDGQMQLARLTIRKANLTQSFTTRNQLICPGEIRLSLVEGPFKMLSGSWSFKSLGDTACKVMLDLSFEPAGALHGFALGSVFGQAANTMVDLFCRRAHALYR